MTCTKSLCEAKPGCVLEPVILDKPGQQCRYSDDHKLEHMDRFLDHELQRLTEKSQKLAAQCKNRLGLKCYRRMRQFLRLHRFVVKVQERDETAETKALTPDLVQKLYTAINSAMVAFQNSNEQPSCFKDAKNMLVTAMLDDAFEMSRRAQEASGFCSLGASAARVLVFRAATPVAAHPARSQEERQFAVFSAFQRVTCTEFHEEDAGRLRGAIAGDADIAWGARAGSLSSRGARCMLQGNPGV